MVIYLYHRYYQFCEGKKFKSSFTFTQVFAFVLQCNASVWGKFNWSKLTTVALANFYDADLVCHAHQHGVRVVKLGKAAECMNVT